jgi:hypothetical protein
MRRKSKEKRILDEIQIQRKDPRRDTNPEEWVNISKKGSSMRSRCREKIFDEIKSSERILDEIKTQTKDPR